VSVTIYKIETIFHFRIHDLFSASIDMSAAALQSIVVFFIVLLPILEMPVPQTSG
jgi:hypothetical protein